MYIKYCDRCGAMMPKEIDVTRIKYPKYYFQKRTEKSIIAKDIDLCDECISKFEFWLNEKNEVYIP